MSLEEKLEEKTKAIGEKKEHPVLRPEIRAKQEEKEKVNASLNRLQELAGLQQNEVQDYKKTKEVIEKLLEKHQIALAEEGITDKKGIISAYPKEKEVKTHLEARQKLKSTAQEIIKERKNLKEAGIEHVRGKELKSDVEKKTESLEEEINKLKSQTPEARRFREKLRRESIVEGQVLIDDRNFINTERLKKVREYGFKDKEIKQIIKDGYS